MGAIICEQIYTETALEDTIMQVESVLDSVGSNRGQPRTTPALSELWSPPPGLFSSDAPENASNLMTFFNRYKT